MERAEVFPPVAVIVLNWNGWQDTIECLETVARQDYPNFNVLVVDNGSDDDSVEKILAWANGEIEEIKTRFPHLVFPLIPKPLPIQIIKHIQEKPKKDNKFYLLPLKQNLGFARGMNIGMRFATTILKSEFVFLLNNDTVLERQTLRNLLAVFKINTQVAMAQPTIYYYNQPDRIANAGGQIFPWGQTKYYKTIGTQEIKKIEFINGCALCIPKTILEKYGYLSEKFFFGEEDFELSLRARKNKLNLVAVGNSRVFHKIAVSSDRKWQKDGRKVVIFALNRLIDMKDFYPLWKWQIWRFFSVFYFAFLLLFRYRIGFWKTYKLIRKIFIFSNRLNQLHKEDIEFILKGEN